MPFWDIQQLEAYLRNPVIGAGGALTNMRSRMNASQDVGDYYMQNRVPTTGTRAKKPGQAKQKPKTKRVMLPEGAPQRQQPQTPAGNWLFPQGGNTIHTSITPGEIYSPYHSQLGINQAQADASQAGSLPYILSQFARPGMSSRSPAAMGRAAPILGNLDAASRSAQVNIPWQDAQANARHLLSGQVARENEAQQLAQIQNQIANANAGYSLSTSMPLLAMLAQFAG